METITLTDDKTRPNDQAMFPPTKLQQIIDTAKKYQNTNKVHLFLQPVIRQHGQKQIHFTTTTANLQQIIEYAQRNREPMIGIRITASTQSMILFSPTKLQQIT